MTGGGGRGLVGTAAWWRDLRRSVTWHRRLLAAGLFAGAVAMALSALTPPPPPSVRVLAAAHDLPAGATLRPDDLRPVELPPSAVPAGAATAAPEVTGRVLAVPMRSGEPLVDLRLVGRSLLEAYGDELVATPVRIADAASARLVRAGDVVDVLAAVPSQSGGTGTAALVAAAVRVVSVLPPDESSVLGASDLGEGALLLLATTSATASRLAGAAVTSRLSVTIRST